MKFEKTSKQMSDMILSISSGFGERDVQNQQPRSDARRDFALFCTCSGILHFNNFIKAFFEKLNFHKC
jgi:hypothetical protein